MNIKILNCNNIDIGDIGIIEKKLNIKYAINGTGKSTISKAIQYSVLDRLNGTSRLSELKPYKSFENEEHNPNVSGADNINEIMVFNESYIEEILYRPDELLKGSFDILIRDKAYVDMMGEIEVLVYEIKLNFSNDQEIEDLIEGFKRLSSAFGSPVQVGIHKSSPISKSLKNGNNIYNIPEGLELYKEFIQGGENVKWIKWQIDGTKFTDKPDSCPYCVSDVAEKKEIIDRVGVVYDANQIKNLNEVLSVFNSLNNYFSDDARAMLEKILENANNYSDDQILYLRDIRDQVDRLKDRFLDLKGLGYISFKDSNAVVDELLGKIIDENLYVHLKSDFVVSIVKKVNDSISELIKKAGLLQGKVNKQKEHIENLVDKNKVRINLFLKNAGYLYGVDLLDDGKGEHKLKLVHDELDGEVSDAKARLSYGEKNAFALVLFMLDSVQKNPDLIVLDDPISSFDKNKKYAIIDMLFRRENSFRDKTVLMLTHDLEPIVDMVFHHGDKFSKPEAAFVENVNGIVSEIKIKKSDIRTYVEINRENLCNSESRICKMVFLRRSYEVMSWKGLEYQLLSNVFKKKVVPLFREYDPDGGVTVREMTKEEISIASDSIAKSLDYFCYKTVVSLVSNDNYMKKQYLESASNYEKLHIFRIIIRDKDTPAGNDNFQKFINQSFHIENDNIYQLNPLSYPSVPQFVIAECNRILGV